MDAILPVKHLTNRQAKRAFIKDASKIALSLETINQSFIYQLFNSPRSVTYNEIYADHLEKWNKKVNEIVKSKEINNAAIDILFFTREYGPNQNFIL